VYFTWICVSSIFVQLIPNETPRLSCVPVGAEDKNRFANVIPRKYMRTRKSLLENEEWYSRLNKVVFFPQKFVFIIDPFTITVVLHSSETFVSGNMMISLNRDVINSFNCSTMSFYGKGYYYHPQIRYWMVFILINKTNEFRCLFWVLYDILSTLWDTSVI
jgi:hypothetical protein